jgi:hypothetical protein
VGSSTPVRFDTTLAPGFTSQIWIRSKATALVVGLGTTMGVGNPLRSVTSWLRSSLHG